MSEDRSNEGWHLTNGERHLAVRALRYYINAEQRAVQAAVCAARVCPAKYSEHARDVKRQADQHIAAARSLIDKLRDNFQSR